MAKKIAGQTGRSVSAGGEMSVGSGCLSTGDYTAYSTPCFSHIKTNIIICNTMYYKNLPTKSQIANY